ncbi:MAG: phosphatidylserine decarboxylase, partial [Sinobacteraceae bacterium]|nr:phosphatidylserine decarboxylase [Nevskiaceae bacterium]
DPLAYASFNEFFTRALRPGARPTAQRGVLASPVDGAISQIGRLDGSRMMQAKGHSYSLERLLDCGDAEARWASAFVGGCFATLYLAPFNYHRIHMPLDGTLRAAWYVPGRLFSVNAVTAASVPALFTRNERIVCIFEDGSPRWRQNEGHWGGAPNQTGDSRPRLFALVLVGALFVGSMETVWHGELTPCSPRKYLELPLDTARAPLRLGTGDEMGRFNMGSTVILITPPNMIEWLSTVQAGDRISVGQPLGRLHASSMSAHG